MVERIVNGWKSATNEGGLRWQAQVVVFCCAFLLIVSHRPDALRYAQFYAEDGMIWFAQAYNSGWIHALTLSQNGYFQTLPRLAASVALLVPLRWAPLTMNLMGLTVQTLPVTLLLSRRLANWAPLRLRIVWALAYVALPNAMELEATITEGQWHLALLSCLVILANVPTTAWWRVFDLVVLIVGGFTGPFCLLLLPMAATYWYLRRERWRAVPVAVLSITALAQLSAVIRTAAATRSQAPLGATAKLFLQLVAGRVYMSALWGEWSLQTQQHSTLLVLAAFIGTIPVVYCVWRGRPELRLLTIFSSVILGVSMLHPMASYVEPQWKVLSTAAGQHYWFLPMVAFVWCVFWCSLDAPNGWVRNTSRLLVLTMPLGIWTDWRYPPYENMQYPSYARQFASAPEGSLVSIPLFPRGWELSLVKKEPGCSIYPEGMMDFPRSGSTVSGVVSVSGWAVASDKHIKQIFVKVDDHSLPPFTPQNVRPDVDKLYPDAPDKDKGWQTSFDSATLTAGEHHIGAWAVQHSGCITEFARVAVERGR